MEHLPPSPLFHKPASIVAAKNILYADLFLSIITWAIDRWTAKMYAPAPLESIVILLVTLAITFGLIKFIGLGRKWTRVVFLVLFLLGLVVYPWSFAVLLKTNMLIAMLSLLQAILQAVALYYLFSRTSTEWFNKVQEKGHEEPAAGFKQ